MRIARATSTALSIPLERPLYVGNKMHLFSRFNPVVVQLTTDEGIEGFGIAFAEEDKRVRTLKTAIDEVCEVMIGQEVFRGEEAWGKLFEATGHMGHRGYGIYALSAIDSALWVIRAKALGMPLSRLLGGYRDSVPAYASHKLFRNWSLDELQEDAASLVARGFRCVKMNMGDKPLRDEVERFVAVREAVGDDIEIMIDANWSWTVPEAIAMGRALEPYDVRWLEDPVATDEPEDLVRVGRALSIPIAAGETFCTKYEFRALLEKRAADVLIVDLQRVGGVTEWMKVAALAQAWKVPVASHLFDEFSLHLVAAVPNGSMVEYMPWWDVIYQEPPTVEDGHMTIPDKPGLGFELDAGLMERYRM
ncbi:MAG: mandelate racemase/muconate lactonizing enzyme family protein [Thermoleophilia bacterium]|nr:mandelate racemase/muconate lactonizing enzyme family protein [Thermoleophilia bacterium]